MKLLNLIIILSIILSPITLAATIHGAVYDLSLEPIKNLIIEIDTHPSQRLVSKTGAYSFEVPIGSYTIKAKNSASEILATENITVSEKEGNYVVDLFVFPDFEEKPEKTNYWPYILILIVLIIVFSIIVFRKLKKKPKIEEIQTGDIEKILKILKENDGRINQKELRKHFPLSEAKMSLLIAQLEKEGKIEKIKKGRGNILILK